MQFERQKLRYNAVRKANNSIFHLPSSSDVSVDESDDVKMQWYVIIITIGYTEHAHMKRRDLLRKKFNPRPLPFFPFQTLILIFGLALFWWNHRVKNTIFYWFQDQSLSLSGEKGRGRKIAILVVHLTSTTLVLGSSYDQEMK